MPLVDYSDSDSDTPPPTKQLKSPSGKPQALLKPSKSIVTTTSALPPLPAAFHDLYASTVRTATSDNPTLHHGRKRTTPHAAGRWPSHLYIEWRPEAPQHHLLTSLVTQVQTLLSSDVESSSSSEDEHQTPPSTVTTTTTNDKPLLPLLENDLGTPQPLHISLSRPLTLTNINKDSFLTSTRRAIENIRASPFSISPTRLEFFTSPDSKRSFLVLSVRTLRGNPTPANTPVAGTKRKAPGTPKEEGGNNGPLVRLLKKCNETVEGFGQPVLYAGKEEEEEGGKGKRVDVEAFHVSIAWMFRRPSREVRDKVARLLEEEKYKGIVEWKVPVRSVKIKIGNTVTDVPLRVTGGQSLFV